MSETFLAKGYHKLAPDMLANVVTALEMTARPELQPVSAPEALLLRPFEPAGVAAYRDLYLMIGRDWMWFSRLVMAEDKLAAILADRNVETYVLADAEGDVGLLELDFREERTCEIAFFGLAPRAIGKGAGRYLMAEALVRAWARPIDRLWVHTCTFDHPRALEFYRRSGFVPFARMVEVHDDPRLTGHMPRDAGPQVPLLGE
ncbi:MAG: GNAT family N-acetyltransferase [Rhizobiales bacterium]|nr:GNAT family N-acetyltransferase [Hyphomicrobiales bacterium]MBI3672905.1 GNAT family N-acetyltransferase [Hyphomicrobiales bacterium]